MKTYHLLNGCLFPYHLALSQDLLPAPDPNMLQESESHIVSGKRKLILPKNSPTLKMHTGTKLNNRCENGTKGIISWRTICNVRANQMHCCGQVTVENSIPLTVFWNMDPKFTWFDQGEMETFPWPKTEEGTIVNRNVGESITLSSYRIQQENQDHTPFTRESGYVVSGKSPPKKAPSSVTIFCNQRVITQVSFPVLERMVDFWNTQGQIVAF